MSLYDLIDNISSVLHRSPSLSISSFYHLQLPEESPKTFLSIHNVYQPGIAWIVSNISENLFAAAFFVLIFAFKLAEATPVRN